MRVQEWLESILSDPIALAMTGLGISFIPFSEYVGGIFLAVAAATWARHFSPERSRKEFWAVMLGGFIAGHVAVIAANVWFPTWPPQLVMTIAGFFSRFLARFTMSVTNQLEENADGIGTAISSRIKKTIK